MALRDTLTASAAERWINCPGSVRLSVGIKDEPSKYASEGVAAHSLAEQMLRYYLKTRETEKGLRQRFRQGTALSFKDHGKELIQVVSQEMLDYVMVYVNRVIDLNGELHIEVNVRHEADRGRNAYADAVIDQKHTLVVVDFKYGFMPVRLVDGGRPNPQLMYYAAGALQKFQWKHKTAQLEIVQPRSQEVPDVQSVTYPAEMIRDWMDGALWEARHAVDDPNARLETGPWCRFCPAIAICPKQVESANELAKSDFASMQPAQPIIPTNPTQLARILVAAPMIHKWLEACESEAQRQLKSGARVPGFKLVRKRSNREWPADLKPSGLAKIFKVKVDDVLTEPKMMSPAQLEKAFPKMKSVINELADKPEGELIIAPESDRREAVANAASDFEELL